MHPRSRKEKERKKTYNLTQPSQSSQKRLRRLPLLIDSVEGQDKFVFTPQTLLKQHGKRTNMLTRRRPLATTKPLPFP